MLSPIGVSGTCYLRHLRWLSGIVALTVSQALGCGLLLDVDPNGRRDAAFEDVDSDRPITCSRPSPEGSVIAYWSFDDLDAFAFQDPIGRHDGSIVGTAPTRAPGWDGCGGAMRFDFSTEKSYGLVPMSDAFELDSGSIELWVKVPSDDPLGPFGILSRDMFSTGLPGHWGLWVSDQGHIIVRIQGTGSAWACADAPASDRWTHVAVSWGPPGLELWIDGVLQTRTAPLSLTACRTETVACGGDFTGGIAGNQLPFYFGISSACHRATDETLNLPFVDGIIDEVVLRDERWPPSP